MEDIMFNKGFFVKFNPQDRFRWTPDLERKFYLSPSDYKAVNKLFHELFTKNWQKSFLRYLEEKKSSKFLPENIIVRNAIFNENGDSYRHSLLSEILPKLYLIPTLLLTSNNSGQVFAYISEEDQQALCIGSNGE